MVTISLEGGFGNQLFQQSFIWAYAKKHGLDYVIGTEVNNPHQYDKKIYKIDAYKFPGINYTDNPPLLPVYNEKHYHYEEIPKMDNVCFRGYFQSWKYFDDYRDELLKVLGFDDIKAKRIFCSIHIRLGDYLEYSDYHPIVTKEYLKEAMVRAISTSYENLGVDFFQTPDDYNFLVFSDSMEIAKEMLASPEFKMFNIEYSEGKSELEDLRDMANCENNITANSTFSLIAAYINPNPNKIIISPKNWFGKAFQHNTNDLYLPETIII